MIFHVCLVYTIATTIIWLFLMTTGIDGGLFFGNYRITIEQVAGFAMIFVLFWMVWSYGFHWLKYWLLRRAGFNRDELLAWTGSRSTGHRSRPKDAR